MNFTYDWKHWQAGNFEGWTTECSADLHSLAAEVWLDHGEWNWTIYRGRDELPGGIAGSAEEAKSAVQERFSTFGD
ncbi:MAG TPA: hypothetical protein VD837_03260 [Terriglobales bacterium]|nr:hypothetical protein [Terriglobales bacterium]